MTRDMRHILGISLEDTPSVGVFLSSFGTVCYAIYTFCFHHEYAKSTINELCVFQAPALIKTMIPGVLQG